MKLDYSDIEKNWPELLPEVRSASELLESELGITAPRVQAKWDVKGSDPADRFVFLEISDPAGLVGYRFLPDELSANEHMKIRLRRLVGDMLMIQSHVGLDRLRWNYSVGQGS